MSSAPALRLAVAFACALAAAAPAESAPQLLAEAPAASGEQQPVAEPAEVEDLVLERLPEPPLDALEPAVAEQLVAARLQVDELIAGDEPPTRQQLADHYGALGQLYHAYDLAFSAEPAYRNAAQLAPEDRRWPYYLGVLAQQAGRLAEATHRFDRVLTLEPRDVPTRFRQAEALRELGEVEVAKKHLEILLQLLPESPAALALLGEIALEGDDPETAVALLERALDQAPDANRLHWPLGMAYRRLGDAEKAMTHLEQRGKVGVRPPDPLVAELDELQRGERVFILRGRMAYGAGRYAQAAEAFREAIAARPEAARARVNLAAALAQLGDADGAIAELRQAIELEPDNATALFNLGRMLVFRGELAEAKSALERAVELAPGDLEARLELAQLLRRGGEWEPALEHFRAVLESAPLDEEAKHGEAVALTELGRYREAIEALEDALSQLPRQGRWAHDLAQLLAGVPDSDLRDGERALYLARNVHRAQPTVRSAQTLAMALAETGDCTAAADVQRQAIDQIVREGGDEALASPVTQQMVRTLTHYRRSDPCRYPVAEPETAERSALTPADPGEGEG